MFSPFSTELDKAAKRFDRGRLYRLASMQIVDRAMEARILSSVGDSLIRVAESAYGFRQHELLGEASRALLSPALGRDNNIAGRYFGALECLRIRDIARGEAILNSLIAEESHLYTGRAMQSLGTVFGDRGDFTSALKLYVEVVRCSVKHGLKEPLSALSSQHNSAVIKALTGDHVGALEGLEQLIPIARVLSPAYPPMKYILLNGLAVEWAALGRIESARRASEIAISSPYAHAYPEWTETFQDIQLKLRRSSRSIVAVSPSIAEPDRTEFPTAKNEIIRRTTLKSTSLVPLPNRDVEHELPEYARTHRSPATVLDFQQWKQRVKPDFDRATALLPEQRSEMTIGEKLIRLMDLISHDDTDDQTIDVILEAVEAIVIQRRGAS